MRTWCSNIIVSVFIVSLTAAGCDSGKVVTPQPAADTTPTAGSWQERKTLGGVLPSDSDSLQLAYPNDPDTLNAITGNDSVGNAFQRWVYEGLASQDYADPDKLIPALAESWEFDEDKLEFTIHLRQGVKWHPMTLPNGKLLPPREFTARDVKFTFDCMLNPNVQAAHIRSYYEDPDAEEASERILIDVEVVDDYTVKARWKKPYFLADDFTLGIGIIPRHVYSVDENGEIISLDFSSREFADGFNNHWANTRMCGTGPLMFDEWQRDVRLVLKRNPDYWGEPFYFDRVVFNAEPNSNTLLQKILQGEMDWAGISQKDHYMQSKEHRNVQSGKVLLREFDYPGYRYIGYNLKHPFLGEKKVRHALTHLVPIEELINVVFYGLAEPIHGPFQPDSTAYDSTIEPLTYDISRARQLLDEAGWVDSDDDGIRDKMVGGRKLKAEYKLTIYADAPAYLTIAQVIQAESRKAGVNVIIDPNKWALMLDNMNNKTFDAAMLGWGMSWRQDPFQLWHGSQAEIPSSSNSVGYQNPEVDRLISQLRVTLNRDEQIPIYHQIHRLIYDDQPYTFLFVDKQTAGQNGRIDNVKFYPIRPGYDVREWYATSPR